MLRHGDEFALCSALLRAAFSYAANFDMPVIHQLRDAGLAGDGVMHEGLYATVLGLRGIPAEAETVPLARDLQLAALTGVRYHAAQLSTGRAVAMMMNEKQQNPRVSCGVSINNLSLNENDVGAYRTYFKLNPPLRSEDDRRALVDLLGTVLLLLPMVGTILWISLPYVARSWAILEGSQETAGVPAGFLLKTAIPVFAAMLILQGVAEILRAVTVLRAGGR